MPVEVEATLARRQGTTEIGSGRADSGSPDRRRLGPLLAVCGLAGGAGATTLAHLTALAAARARDELVLVADTGGPTAALSAYAGVEAPRSLPELAAHLASGLPVRGGLYATGPAGVRVLATGPEFTAPCSRQQLASLLIDAREAHELTVIDCGTLASETGQIIAGSATHAVWVMPASELGVASGQRVLEAAPQTGAKEILVARAEQRQPKAQLRELRRIAAERRAPLVLLPHLRALDAGRVDRALEEAQVTIQAILGVLTR